MPLDRPAGYDVERVQRALDAWKRTTRERAQADKKIRSGNSLEAERPDRVEKYAERLLKNVRNVADGGAGMTQDLREAVRDPREAVRAKASLPFGFLLERMIGEAEEYLSVMFVARAAVVIRSVGRIAAPRSFGTGFLVAPGVLITNNHVLPDSDEAALTRVQFRYEVDLIDREIAPVAFHLNPDRLFVTDPDLDFTLVAVEAQGDDASSLSEFGFLPLVGDQGKIRLGQPVNIIQHPAGERKQLIFRESTLSLLPEALGTVAQYTGDTKPGSSGSPVFSDAWEVVALHHSGVPDSNDRGEWMDVDGNVWDQARDPHMERVKWIANEGIRVSSLVRRIGEMHAEATGSATDLLGEVIRVGKDAAEYGVFVPARRDPGRPGEAAVPPAPRRLDPRPAADANASAPPAGQAVSVTLPLTITVSVDTSGAAAAATATEAARLERTAADYYDRKGFNRDFLGVRVEMPMATAAIAADLATVAGSQETEFRYDHYSVLMNRRRRLAFVSAGNLRIDAPFNAPRRDPWGFDPRLHESLQAGNEFYSENDLDRGHLFRRADGGWGSSPEEARRASDDTFHWTNIAPQHFVFNQSGQNPELSLWGLLENQVMDEASRERQSVNVFNGPIFSDGDPLHRGLAVPRAFWKLVSVVGREGRLRAFAFVVGQEELLRNLPAEAFGPGRFAMFQVSIADLERRTGLDFGGLRGADALPACGLREGLGGGAMVRILSLRDVVGTWR